MFSKPIAQFRANLELLRDFTNVLEPFLKEQLLKGLKEKKADLYPLWLAMSKTHSATEVETERTLEEAAGRCFQIVFLPGLAEGVMPKK